MSDQDDQDREALRRMLGHLNAGHFKAEEVQRLRGIAEDAEPLRDLAEDQKALSQLAARAEEIIEVVDGRKAIRLVWGVSIRVAGGITALGALFLLFKAFLKGMVQ